MRFIHIAIVILFAIHTSSVNADVEVRPVTSSYWKIYLSKQIVKADAKRFNDLKQAWLRAKNEGEKLAIEVNLNTSGGDLYAALQIGYILREIHALATMDEHDICYSSCVFVLSGAVFRSVEGSVGIHRPYLAEAEVTDATREKAKYEKYQTDIEKFLTEVNIDPKLYKDMLLIRPRNMKILSRAELDGYGLAQNDVYADEASDMNRAKELGISRRELAARHLTVERICNRTNYGDEQRAILDYLNCKFRVEKTGQ